MLAALDVSVPLFVCVQLDWMEDSMPYYPPTVNDPEAYKFAMEVAGRCECM